MTSSLFYYGGWALLVFVFLALVLGATDDGSSDGSDEEY